MISELLKFSLFGGANPIDVLAKPLDESEWNALFDESRRQAVTALTYDAIMKLPKEQRPSRSVLFHFASMTQTIGTDNNHRETVLARFAEKVNEELGIDTVVVKGSSIGRLYPEPMHRECGDNDILTGVDTDRVSRLFEDIVPIDRKDPRHDSLAFDGVMFELHRWLLYHGDDPDWTPVTMDDSLHLQHLPLEQEAFFIAKHIEHHSVFFHHRLRLRDLVDWSMLVTAQGFDRKKFNELKRGTDVEVFAELMTAYCVRIFGMNVGENDLRGLQTDDFEKIYMHCPERHRLAVVRVARRSWHYMRYARKYRRIYGQSMFRRFYINNLKIAIKQNLKP